MMDKIRVLIVDDSALAREALKEIINSDSGLEVIAEAKDGREGVEKALVLKPDVITMDLKMPLMGGLEAIEEIMNKMPIPIIVVSSLDVSVIVKALSIGVMDFVAITQDIEKISEDLIEKIKIASRIKPIRRIKIPVCSKKSVVAKVETAKVVVIGVSTGGPQALQVVFAGLPSGFKAGVLVVQHIANGFIEGLAEWLKSCCALDISVAKSGEILKSGSILFAPDNYNLHILGTGEINLKEDITRKMSHVPSIDEAMKSAAEAYGENAVGVLMTGMGRDGVEGLKAIKMSGGKTIAQDEKSSVVFGMNKAAIDCGCVDVVVPLEEIAGEVTRSVNS
jgi:two-component system chemotaxis response regulator CheB